MIHIVDHIFMFLLFVVQPIHGAWSFNRYIAGVEAGEPADRVKLYQQTHILEWVAFAVLAATWSLLGRPIAALGFVTAGGTAFWIGLALTAVASAFLLYAWRQSKLMTADEKARQRQTFGKLEHFLPRTDRELRFVFGLSVTAGIVEETIYRGFALWYLAQLMPLWAAVVASAVVFGLGHSYQGAGGVARVAAIGVVFGAFYVLTGSIWLPILAHILLDALQGLSIAEILREDGETTDSKQR